MITPLHQLKLVILDTQAYYLLTKSLMPGLLGEGEARVSFRIVEFVHTCSLTNRRVRPRFRKIVETLENKLENKLHENS